MAKLQLADCRCVYGSSSWELELPAYVHLPLSNTASISAHVQMPLIIVWSRFFSGITLISSGSLLTMPPNVRTYLVAWITSSPTEHAASKSMFDEEYHELPADFLRKSDDHNLYAWGSISGHNVVVVMGRQLKAHFRTPVVDTFAKICGSLPDVRLCLLVVSG